MASKNQKANTLAAYAGRMLFILERRTELEAATAKLRADCAKHKFDINLLEQRVIEAQAEKAKAAAPGKADPYAEAAAAI